MKQYWNQHTAFVINFVSDISFFRKQKRNQDLFSCGELRGDKAFKITWEFCSKVNIHQGGMKELSLSVNRLSASKSLPTVSNLSFKSGSQEYLTVIATEGFTCSIEHSNRSLSCETMTSQSPLFTCVCAFLKKSCILESTLQGKESRTGGRPSVFPHILHQQC